MNEQGFGFCSSVSFLVPTVLPVVYVNEGLQTACDRFPKARINGF